MGVLADAWGFLADGANWSGSFGIPSRLFEHVQMSLYGTVLGAAIAMPVGMFVGHTRRLEFLAISVGNLGRALPSFGILALVFPFSLRYLPGSIGFSATLIAMFLLAIPPILINTYVGIQNVDSDVVEAARGMGMSGREILWGIELPLAAPLIVAGIRNAAVAVVATATLGALAGWGGLGRFIIDGRAVQDFGEMVAGAFLVAALAVLTELGLSALERRVSPRGVKGHRWIPSRKEPVELGAA
jgi:osmoprotectant transport system permease protein